MVRELFCCRLHGWRSMRALWHGQSAGMPPVGSLSRIAALVLALGLLAGLGVTHCADKPESPELPGPAQEVPRLTIGDAVYARPSLLDGRQPASPVEGEDIVSGASDATTPIAVYVFRASMPVDGAAVYLGDSSRYWRVGETDAYGAWRGQRSISTCRVAAQSQGFATERASLSEDTNMVTLDLEEEGVIQGRVTWSDGNSAREAFVAAWEDGHPPNPDSVRCSLSSGTDSVAEFELTRTDAEGRFRLAGLGKNSGYTLSAGMPGGASSEHSGIFPGADGLEIELESLYGVVVVLADSDGGPIQAGSRLFGRGPVWRVEDLDASAVQECGPALSLAGVSARMLGGHGRRLDSQLLLYRTRGQPEKITIHYEVEVPGYKSAWTTLHAFRLDQAARYQEISLVRQESRRGVVRVTVRGLPVDAAFRKRPLGMVFLASGATALNFGIPIPCDRYEVDKIPAGEYRWRFENKDWPFSYPSSPGVIVIGNAPAELSIDLSGLGGLVLDARTPGDQAYTGAIRFLLTDPMGKRRSFLAFDSAPYFACGFQPGEYMVRVDWCPGRAVEAFDELLCVVLPDQMTHWPVLLGE